MLIKRKSIEAQANSKKGVSKKTSDTALKSTKKKVKYGPVTLSELNGCRYLHFGTEWVQGGMRIRKPDWLELEYSQQMMAWMLFIEKPQHIVQLGLGSGALTKFCYRQFPRSRVTTVELNPAVITICHSMFKLPFNDDRLNVMEMDADEFVKDTRHHGMADVMQVDLYDATARGPVLDSIEFYQGCADCLTPEGIMTVNLFGEHPSYAKNLKAMIRVFAMVIFMPPIHDGNVIAIAFKKKKEYFLNDLHERASQIKLATKLPAKSWVDGIQLTTES